MTIGLGSLMVNKPDRDRNPVILGLIPGHADDEKIAEPLVEYQLGWHPRVATSEDRGKRLLVGNKVLPPIGTLMRVPCFPIRETCVSGFEPGKCFGGIRRKGHRYERFRRPGLRRKKDGHAGRGEDLTARKTGFHGSGFQESNGSKQWQRT